MTGLQKSRTSSNFRPSVDRPPSRPLCHIIAFLHLSLSFLCASSLRWSRPSRPSHRPYSSHDPQGRYTLPAPLVPVAVHQLSRHPAFFGLSSASPVPPDPFWLVLCAHPTLDSRRMTFQAQGSHSSRHFLDIITSMWKSNPRLRNTSFPLPLHPLRRADSAREVFIEMARQKGELTTCNWRKK